MSSAAVVGMLLLFCNVPWFLYHEVAETVQYFKDRRRSCRGPGASGSVWKTP